MTWGQIAVNALAAILLVVGTWITARFTRKTGKEANDTQAAQARTADWSTFVQEQRAERAEERKWLEARLAERDRRIERLEQRVGSLQERFDALERKYRLAIAYIRRLVRKLQQHVDPEDIETPPDEISPDL
ncbi:hypothetical protein [Dietzia cercidiphylli]|uniref:hypothetical protein n=2 Tax=Dietzia cercidiphylli TaxID=498199 RepID=UPI0015F91EA7|nr:hypothetical protein [Dietzia cercidiphylli]MBB1046477.1 DUF3450 domain-containing protein [Dietzia cercidiphylli]